VKPLLSSMPAFPSKPQPKSSGASSDRRGSGRFWSLALACLLGLGANSGNAQDNSPEDDDLRTRVEELERTNRDLIRALRDQHGLDLDDQEDDESTEGGLQYYEIADKADDKKKVDSGKGTEKKEKKESKPEDEWYEVGSDLSMSAS